MGMLGLIDCAKLVTDSWCCCSWAFFSQLCIDMGAWDCTEGEKTINDLFIELQVAPSACLFFFILFFFILFGSHLQSLACWWTACCSEQGNLYPLIFCFLCSSCAFSLNTRGAHPSCPGRNARLTTLDKLTGYRQRLHRGTNNKFTNSYSHLERNQHIKHRGLKVLTEWLSVAGESNLQSQDCQ